MRDLPPNPTYKAPKVVSGWIILAPHGVEYHSFRRLRGEAIRQYAGNVATWRELRKIGWRCVRLEIRTK